jgi:hypothetical protein
LLEPLRGPNVGRKLLVFDPLHGTGHVILSWRCRDGLGSGLGCGVGAALTTRLPDDVVPSAKALLFRGRDGPSLPRRRAGCGSWVGVFNRCPPCMGRLRLFPQCTSPVVGSVVRPAAIAFKLLLWSRAATWLVGIATRHAPGSVPAVTLGMSKALTALTLYRELCCNIRFNRYPQSTELGEGAQISDLGAPRHRDNEMGVRGRSCTPSWWRRPVRSCINPWTLMPRVASSSRTTLSCMVLPRVFPSSLTLRSSGSEKVWKDTPLLASRDPSAATLSRKSSAVSGTSKRRSALMWAVILLRQWPKLPASAVL